MSVTDRERKWWLARFGVPAEALRGISAAEYVSQNGMPAELLALAASVPALH